MRRLALAATLVALGACNPPPMTAGAAPTASENAARSPIVRMAAATKPVLVDGDPIHLVTTTTSPLPPATTAPPAPPVTAHAHPSPVGACGGWEGLIAAYFPGDAVAEACVIARCESEWNAGAIGGPNTNGTYDVGLFQINDIHGLSRDERLNPETNVAFAARLYAQSGWRPWTCRSALV